MSAYSFNSFYVTSYLHAQSDQLLDARRPGGHLSRRDRGQANMLGESRLRVTRGNVWCQLKYKRISLLLAIPCNWSTTGFGIESLFS